MQALEEDVGRKEAEITSLQAALDRTKQEAGEYATHLEGEVESSKATIAEATQSIQALEEDLGRKEAEIASLQAALDKSKQEAGEYATHLEGEVESLQANTIEAARELNVREEQVVQYEHSLSVLQKDVDMSRVQMDSLLQKLIGNEESMKQVREREGQLMAKLDQAQATLEWTKQEAAEYATHLEEEVETSKASIMEAAEELKSREAQAARLEDALALSVSNVEQLQKDFDQVSLEVERLTIDRDSKAAEAIALGSSLADLTHAHEKLLQQIARRDDELAVLLKEASGAAHSKGSELQEVVMNRQDQNSPKSPDGAGFIFKKETKKALRAARPNSMSTSLAQSTQQAAEVNEPAAEVKSMTSILRDQMTKKDQEIITLHEKLEEMHADFEGLKLSAEKARRESEDYATHLEEEIETSKASIAEAAETMQALENDLVAKEKELTALRLLSQEHQESITSLETKLQDVVSSAERAKKEATDYATHLEEEVESSKVQLVFPIRAAPPPFLYTLSFLS
jgi:chromosome segregation ATPase